MRLFRTCCYSFALLLIAVLPFTISAAAQGHGEHGGDACPHWGYSGPDGPEHWGDLCAAYAACKNGKQQSPVDINKPQPANLPSIHLNSRPAPLKLVNNGHTIMQQYSPGNGNVLMVGDKTYELQQFHFHHPSEETIEGKPLAMVAHLVYKSKDGSFAVVGVLVKEGKPNQLISLLWKHMPLDNGKENDDPHVEVNAIQLVPAKLSYYTFPGSLTTPPCTEGITFYILQTPMQFSREQIAKFAELYPHNARPTQPLNGRVVAEDK